MTFPPDDLPRSPTGRRPAWVEDPSGAATSTTWHPDGGGSTAALRPLGTLAPPGPRPAASPAPASTLAPPGPRPATSPAPASTLAPARPDPAASPAPASTLTPPAAPRPAVVAPVDRRRTSPVLVLLLGVVLAAAWVSWRAGLWSGGDPDWSVLQDPVGLLTEPALPPASARDHPPPGVGEQPAPLGTPPVVLAPDPNHRFIDTQTVDGRELPVTWSPCRVVHVVVNETGAPPGFRDTVAQELATLGQLTGLVFLVDGPTAEVPSTDRPSFQPDRYGDVWAPVLVAFATPEQVPELADDAAGIAQTVATTDPTTGLRTRVSGGVYLDVDTLGSGAIAGTPLHVAVLRHELAHLVGLDHVDDQSQLLHPTTRVATYQAGDRTGLAELGHGVCAPGV